MSFDSEKELRSLEKKLKEMQQKEHIPAELLELLAQVYKAQISARKDATVNLPGDAALAPAERRLQGVSLLEREAMPYDLAQTTELFEKLLNIAENGSSEKMKEAAAVVRAEYDAKDFSLEETYTSYLNGDNDFFYTWVEKTPTAPFIMHFLIKSSITPALAAAADALAEKLDSDTIWQHGHCPICGSLPLIGELIGKEGQRHMTCSYCLHTYRTSRLGCVICGETNPQKIKYLSTEDEPGFRMDTCDSCKKYIKIIDFRKLDKKSLPLLDDVQSITLDFIAAEKELARPSLSAWGF